MKIRILSDLHLEFMDFAPPDAAADVIVLAGDVFVEHYGLDWARAAFPNTPIIYVLGNHEFFQAHYETVLERCRKRAVELDIHLLEKDQAVIGGVRFLGTTLWTDFAIDEGAGLPTAMAMRLADQRMNDYRVIRYRGGMLSAAATREFHLQARRWLTDRLAEPFDGPTVVATHHLPHRASIHRNFIGDPLNAAFASHMPELVRPPVALWVHGHTHNTCAYEVDGTRVVCNPRGYGPHQLNPEFDPVLCIDV